MLSDESTFIFINDAVNTTISGLTHNHTGFIGIITIAHGQQ